MRIIDFDIYKDLLKEKSGLVINPDKSYLLETRLGPIAKKWGYASLEGLTQALQGVPNKDLISDIVEAMTTNETSFARDTKSFEVFRTVVLPCMKDKRSKKMSIWCAGCSSGQESYSVTMMLKEEPGFSGWKNTILGTDISNYVLDQAKLGIYTQAEVQQGLPVQLLLKYFTQEDDKWRIKDEIRKMVHHEAFNLLSPMKDLGTFDVIFCRNVLPYFDDETKNTILQALSEQLAPDGFLILDEKETLGAENNAFSAVSENHGLYALKDGPHVSSSKQASPLENNSVSA